MFLPFFLKIYQYNNGFSIFLDDEKLKDTETVDTELLKKLLVVGGVFLIAIGACIAVLLIFRQAREA